MMTTTTRAEALLAALPGSPAGARALQTIHRFELEKLFGEPSENAVLAVQDALCVLVDEQLAEDLDAALAGTGLRARSYADVEDGAIYALCITAVVAGEHLYCPAWPVWDAAGPVRPAEAAQQALLQV